MKAYFRRSDYLLLGLKESPTSTSQAARAAWEKAQVIAKANIISHLGPQPQVRTRRMIDDDNKTAHELWTMLESIYTANNTQAIQNLRHHNDNWDERFSKFMNLLAQLASLDEEFSGKRKTSKLVRSLPESFVPIAMVATLLDSFEKVEQAIRAEVDRPKNPHDPQSNLSDERSKLAISKAYFTNKNKRSGGVSKFKNTMTK